MREVSISQAKTTVDEMLDWLRKAEHMLQDNPQDKWARQEYDTAKYLYEYMLAHPDDASELQDERRYQ